MYDLVVTYLDSGNKQWQERYTKYMNQEIEEGKQTRDNRQAFGEERIRDWETLKYFLRGVEKNCKWVRNVIVIMQKKDQIPKWLNTEYERVRIVEHEDYIPRDILPTFTTSPIEFYISNIEGLSDFYVMCADDYYFLNETPVEMFFKDGKTVQLNNKMPYAPYGEKLTNAIDGIFYQILNNNLKVETKYMGDEKIKYYLLHLPEARDKRLEQQVIKDNEDLFINAFKTSKFRKGTHYCSQLFTNILKIKNECVFDNAMEKEGKYATLKSTLNFEDYKDYKVVCFNDTEQLDDFEITKKKLIEFLERKLPEKSSFEK